MYQPTKSNIEIIFYSIWSLPNDFICKETLIEAIIEFYWTTAEGKFVNKQTNKQVVPKINIINFESSKNKINIEFYSSKRNRLEFQSKLFKSYIDANYSDKIYKFDENIWVQL